MSIQLSYLKKGACGRIQSLNASAVMRQRLMDLGFIPGTSIFHVMDSPIGDPICFRVRGALIALRVQDADQVIIEV